MLLAEFLLNQIWSLHSTESLACIQIQFIEMILRYVQ